MNASALLLADRSAALRRRVLVELAGVGADDPEVRELAPRVAGEKHAVLAELAGTSSPRDLGFALCRLAHLGLGAGDNDVAAVARRLFVMQRADGSWPLPDRRGEVYQMIPLQTALPLRGLAAAGFAADGRSEKAYAWLLGHRLDDGSWPTGLASGQRGYVAGYRRLPRSAGCRTNTTGALACLALHPERCRSSPARVAAEHILRREPRDELSFGYEVSRLRGAEPLQGFMTFYARLDLAFILELVGRVGASRSAPRVADLAAEAERRRGAAGIWEHPSHPHLSRWLTLDLLLALGRLDEGDWVTGDDL